MKLGIRVLSLCLLCAASALPQVPTFKAEVDYVEIDALVTDKQGNFVRDLKPEDFQLLEDGKPQSIDVFSLVDIKIEQQEQPAGAKQAVEPDVKTNAQRFDGRVYVMLIDDAHTRFGRSDRVKRAARQFIERRLASNDLMAIVHTAGPSDASQEFTSNKRLLLAAVDRTMGRGLQSATVGKADEYAQRANTGRSTTDTIKDPDDAERGLLAHTTLQTLRQIADWFTGVRGRRKAILFLSEGIDYDVTNVMDNPSASTVLDDTRQVIEAAARSNVSIYGIDPRGLTSLEDEEIEVASYPDDTSLGIGHGSLMAELRHSQESLQVLSDETGGFAAINSNDFQHVYERIVKENSSYYLMSFHPPGDRRDGKFHKIQLKVLRPDLKVQARRGYSLAKRGKPEPAPKAPDPKAASPEMRQALDSPLPISGVTLSVFAAAFKGTGSKASVLLGEEVRGRDLRLDPADKLELSHLAVDAKGKVTGGDSDTVVLNLKPETRARVQQGGLRITNRLELAPGRYQLRVAAHDTGSGSLGSVIYDLEVPDYSKSPLAISGIALSSAAATAITTVRPDEALKGTLPGPPVAWREFPQNDQVALYAEVYDNQRGPAHQVEITASVTNDEGQVVFRTQEERSSTELHAAPAAGFLTPLKIRDLQPGSYLLRLEARSRLGKESAFRELQFTVVPARTP